MVRPGALLSAGAVLVGWLLLCGFGLPRPPAGMGAVGLDAGMVVKPLVERACSGLQLRGCGDLAESVAAFLKDDRQAAGEAARKFVRANDERMVLALKVLDSAAQAAGPHGAKIRAFTKYLLEDREIDLLDVVGQKICERLSLQECPLAGKALSHFGGGRHKQGLVALCRFGKANDERVGEVVQIVTPLIELLGALAAPLRKFSETLADVGRACTEENQAAASEGGEGGAVAREPPVRIPTELFLFVAEFQGELEQGQGALLAARFQAGIIQGEPRIQARTTADWALFSAEARKALGDCRWTEEGACLVRAGLANGVPLVALGRIEQLSAGLCTVSVKVYEGEPLRFMGAEDAECGLRELLGAAARLGAKAGATLHNQFAELAKAEGVRAAQRERERQAKDRAGCTAAASQDTIGAWRAYLAEHPEGSCRTRAETRIRALEAEAAARVADQRACLAAREAGTKEAWQGYLAQHGSGECVAEAQEKLRAFAREERLRAEEQQLCARATREDRLEVWREYLASFSAGPCRAKAEERVAALEAEARKQREDRAACVTAKAADTKESWQAYLAAHPAGVCVGRAKRRLAEFAQAEREQAEFEALLKRDPFYARRVGVSLFGRLEGGMDFRQATQGVGGNLILGLGLSPYFDLSLGFAPVVNVLLVDAEFNLLKTGRWVPTLGLRGGFGVGRGDELYTVEADAGLEFWIYDFWGVYLKVGCGYAWGHYRGRDQGALIVPGWLGSELRW